MDSKRSSRCSKFGKISVLTCEDGFICDPSQCAKVFGCCVAGETCQSTQDSCLDEHTLRICVKGAAWVDRPCAEGATCKGGQCVQASCHNGRLDVDEEAVDCGGLCAPCIACRSDVDCGEHGFCDSASGYVCSKRCQTDDDCSNTDPWDGEFCRGDGRCSPKVFETVWELSNKDLEITLPFDPDYPNANCSFQILWGDEPAGTDITTNSPVRDCGPSENRTHKYPEAGCYHVKIVGVYDGWGAFKKINFFGFSLLSAADKLRSVLSFGPVGLSKEAFFGAKELRVMPEKDIPDATKMMSLEAAFMKAFAFNASIRHWDTSKVTNMSEMFSNTKAFNQPIGAWDTSKVVNMSAIFYGAAAFNQPIGEWDISELETMELMFANTKAFNQPIGAWDTSKVKNMGGVFNTALVFNQPIGAWNTSNVNEMSGMFAEAKAFNQAIGDWDTSSVTDMYDMFHSASAFNQVIGGWNTSKVNSMGQMFLLASVFNQPVGAWDTSQVINMTAMFYLAKAFNQPIDSWNVGKVENMARMFLVASSFDQDLSTWNLKSGVFLNRMFDHSGMGTAHLCALKAKGGAWLEQWWNLGKEKEVCK